MGATSPFPTLFGRSPFKSLRLHMHKSLECAELVPDLLSALGKENWNEINTLRNMIFDLESEADAIKNDLRSHLPKSLFMPVDRRDILELLDLQDSIADVAEDLGELLVKRPISPPKTLHQPMQELAQKSVEACRLSCKLVDGLEEMTGFGFSGNAMQRTLEIVDQLDKVEKETDQLGMTLAITLFSLEDDVKPVSMICWYQMFQWLGNLADYAEKIGSRMRLFVAR
ncbi:MAG: TIGR00153 family protein [Magnetococcales bacterium]|nr:TIGR00153 family protein [Magnetococcales bacterium]